MLAKLLKHELKADGSVMGTLCAASLGVGLIGGLTMRYLLSAEGNAQEGALVAIAMLLLFFSFLALALFSAGSGLFLLYQFYKRKFTDEGYLTFTLPAASWQIYLSSLLNILLWTLVTGLVTILAFCLIFFIGLANSQFIMEMKEAINKMREVFDADFYGSIPIAKPSLVVGAVAVQYVGQSVIAMTCITLGSILARRRKLLGAVGAYWVYSMISGAVSSRVLSPLILAENFSLNTYYSVMLVFTLIMSVAGFILSCWLMKKKLNLP